MFNLRGTTRFRKRLGFDGKADPGETTTTLGDWYANVLHLRRQQLVLCTSQSSLLSVVFSAQRLRREFGGNLQRSVATLLRAIGVPEEAACEELERMKDYVITRTESRSVLGSMNDFKVQVEYRLADCADSSYQDLSLELSEVPCGPLNYECPAEMARKLFRAIV